MTEVGGACSCELFRNTMLQDCLFDQEIVPFCFVPLEFRFFRVDDEIWREQLCQVVV